MDIDQQLRERGLPLTPMYQRAQERRNQYFADRRFRLNAARHQRQADRAVGAAAIPHQMAANLWRARVQGGDREMPRAEPDQVVRAPVRGDDGRILGRYAGAITTGLVDKVDVEKPTMEGSTFQMDLMD